MKYHKSIMVCFGIHGYKSLRWLSLLKTIKLGGACGELLELVVMMNSIIYKGFITDPGLGFNVCGSRYDC